MSPDEKPKVLDAYIRVSRVNDREGDSYITKDQQREKIELACRLHGYTVANWYEEEDRSGGDSERPKWNEALRRALEGESDGVICAKLDRWARSAIDGLKSISQLEAAGRAFVSVAENLDTSDPYGRFTATIFLGLAELELGRIRTGWKDAGHRAAARGVVVGTAPTGYHKTTRAIQDGSKERIENTGLVKIAADCEKIAQAYKVRAGGGSWSEVARTLEGVKGKRWATTGARNLLASRIYRGILTGGGQDFLHEHLVVVSGSVWDAANHRADPKPGRRDPGQRSFAAGILKCAGCGRALSLSFTRGADGHTYGYWRCNSGGSFCSAQARAEWREGEKIVTMATEAAFGVFGQAGRIQTGQDSDPATIARLEQERDEAIEYVETLTASITSGTKVPVEALNAAQERVEAAVAALVEETGKTRVTLTSADAHAVLEAGTVEEQRALIRQVLSAVVVTKGTEPLRERAKPQFARERGPDALIEIAAG